MGWFSSKPKDPLAGLQPYKLREGTLVPMVDVDESFIEAARQAVTAQPRLGHEVPVALVARGSDIAVYHNGAYVGRMEPEHVGYYIEEMQELARVRHYGDTTAFVRKPGAKSPHALSLNWGYRAVNGGLL